MAKISKYFTLDQLTVTSNAKLQAQNRAEAALVAKPLTEVAVMMDKVQDALGAAVDIHSGFRCLALNGATAGSSKKSQHLKGEACDFSPFGPDTELSIDAAFQKILAAFISTGVTFGQFIKESAPRDYGRVYWLHLSLGAPWRDPALCGQVMTMLDGKYALIKTVPFGR